MEGLRFPALQFRFLSVFMAKQFESITPQLASFIADQKIFFVATAMSTGHVNVSPKGMDSFRIVDPNRVMWLNVTGSGNETAAHLLESNRITVMFCAFEGKPLILRLYGTANVYHDRDAAWEQHISLFPKLHGARQIIDIQVEIVQTSCGMAVPFMDYNRERDELDNWARKKGDNGIKEYWQQKNLKSIDGAETGIFS